MSLKPSEIVDKYWIFSINESYEFKLPREERRSGKWLIFDNIKEIDKAWEIIRTATELGKLGPSSKVSTSKENKNTKDSNTRVICVFTENYNDILDVERIEKKLRELGVINKLLYKLDSNVGKYEQEGYKHLIEQVSYSREYEEELNRIRKDHEVEIERQGHRTIVMYRREDLSEELINEQKYLERLGIYLEEQR